MDPITGTFTLTVTLGNAAMSSVEDVASALRHVAARLDNTDQEHGLIFDTNGNAVGRFDVEREG